jgi:hypothetical protein
MLIALDPPQISAEFWGHAMLQLDESMGAALFMIAVPQKHCVPNSMPAKVKPRFWQVDWHASTVPPETSSEVLRARADVLSE